MRFKSVEAKMKLSFHQDIFITDEVDQEAQHCITSPRRGVTKCLQGHDPAKRRIKKINDRQNKISCTMNMTSHSCCKNIASYPFMARSVATSCKVSYIRSKKLQIG